MGKIQDSFQNISIKIIDSIEKIDSIVDDWRLIHNLHNSSNIYTDPNFFKSMYFSRATSNSKVNVVLFKKNDYPIAIIIGWVNQKYTVTNWVGYFKLNSPFLTCFEIENNGVITNGDEESANLVFSLLKNMIRRKKVDLVTFNHLSSKNPLWNKIMHSNDISRRIIIRRNVNWIAIIRDSRTGERKSLHSKKTEAKLLRKAKKFRRSFNNQIKIKKIIHKTEVLQFIKNADRITQNSYHYLLKIGITDTQNYRDILMTLAQKDYLRAFLLFVENKPVAYIMGIQYLNTMFLFSTSFDSNYKQYSPGEFLRHEIVDDLLDLGIDIVDYGYGDSIYKQREGTECIKEASLRIYGKGIKAFSTSIIDRFISYSYDRILKLIADLGLLQIIKNNWRQKIINKPA